jgi:hypothetical protein
MGNAYRLKTYSRTNKYHWVNDRQIAIKDLKIGIYCTSDDLYGVKFHHYDEVYPISGLYIIPDLSFETIWKIIKPSYDSNMPVNYTIGDDICYDRLKYRYYKHSSDVERAAQKIRITKLKALIYNKLHESETEYKKKLRKNQKFDCKIYC